MNILKVIDNFYLFNSVKKKIIFIHVIFFAFLSPLDFDMLFFVPTKFDQLNTSVGKIYIVDGGSRSGDPFLLKINDKKILFRCQFLTNETCLYGPENNKVQGKVGKVWWAYNHGYLASADKWLYQLEVDGENIITYENKKKYYSKKYFPLFIGSFFVFLYMYIKIQFK